MKKIVAALFAMLLLASPFLGGQAQDTQVNLLSLQEGTFPVIEPES